MRHGDRTAGTAKATDPKGRCLQLDNDRRSAQGTYGGTRAQIPPRHKSGGYVKLAKNFHLQWKSYRQGQLSLIKQTKSD